MARPTVGQKRADGKRYAGENYGYQSPATYNKLKEQGKFKLGTQALDRVGNAVQRTGIPQKVAAAQKQFRDATDKIPGIKQLEAGVNNTNNKSHELPSARVAQGAAIAAQRAGEALNVDPRIALAGGLLLGRVRTGAQIRVPRGTRPTGTIKAGKLAPSPALNAARKQPSAAQVARQASGPAHPVSDPKQLAPGNSPAKQKPVNFTLKKQLKQKAVNQHVKIATEGYTGRVKRQPRGEDTSNYLPNRGRVSPTDKGRLAKLNETYDKRLAKALEGKRGADRQTARNEFLRQETKRKRNVQYDARTEAEQFQKAQEAKRLKGSTPESRDRMADDMGIRKGKPPLSKDREGALAAIHGVKRRPSRPTTTTGTRRVPTNPEAGTSQRGVRGRIIEPYVSKKTGQETYPRTTARSKPAPIEDSTKSPRLKPQSGASNLNGSFSRQRTTNKPGADGKTVIGAGRRQEAGGTPRGIIGYREVNGKKVPIRANNGNARERSATNLAGRSIDPKTGRPYSSGKAPTGKARLPQGGNPAESFSPAMRAKTRIAKEPKPRSTSPEDEAKRFKELSPGEQHRESPGLSGKPKDVFRGSPGKGGASSDTHTTWYPTRKDFEAKTNGKRIGRLGQSTPKGQPSSAVDTPGLRRRKAAAAARAKGTTPTPPKPPTRSASKATQLRAVFRAGLRSIRETRGMSKAQVKALVNKFNKELPTSPTTHFNGEVRLQGSKYSIDPQAKNLVDGSVSRSIGKPKNQGRSAEASAAAKRTTDAVRTRQAKRARAERIIAGKKVPSRTVNGRTRVRGTGQTIKNKRSSKTSSIRNLLLRMRGSR